MFETGCGRRARAWAIVATLGSALTACAQTAGDDTSPVDVGRVDGAPPRADATAPRADASRPALDDATTAAPDTSTGATDASAPPLPDDAAPPLPTCTRNEECAGFRADAGPDGDVEELCYFTSNCTGPGYCFPTSGCDPSASPTCGCDGKTYATACDAIRTGVSLPFQCDAGSP